MQKIKVGKGACTNDVCSEGEGGGWLNSDQREGGCVDLVLTRGREGVQNHRNLADVISTSPLMVSSLMCTHFTYINQWNIPLHGRPLRRGHGCDADQVAAPGPRMPLGRPVKMTNTNHTQ